MLSERNRRELISCARFSLAAEGQHSVPRGNVAAFVQRISVVTPARAADDVKLFSITPDFYHDIYCPACGKAIYRVFHDREEVIGGSAFTRDGDTIPYLYEELY